MVRFSLLILMLTFSGLVVDLDALLCPKGQKVARGEISCEPCPDRYFQPTENESLKCKGCTECNEESGSFPEVKCTKEKNTVCQCRDGFVSMTDDSSLCQCNPGFGLKNGVCSRCINGYFSNSINSACKPWKDCKTTGVKQPGSETSDAVCNESNLQTVTAPKSVKEQILSVITTRRPHEGGQTPRTVTTTTTTTTQQDKTPPTSHSNTNNHTGVILLLLGIAGLLVWTAITCKMHATLCRQKKTTQNKDSLCRRPVEESGDSSESSFKLNPEP